MPFVWQHDRQLFLLEDTAAGWVAAELRFDPDRCYYIEIRRATYYWAREAAGALLARALTAGTTTQDLLAAKLTDWVMQRGNS